MTMRREELERILAEEREKRDKMSDRDLLVRIDERVIGIVARQDNHGDRILRIELSVVSGLVAAVGALVLLAKDTLMSGFSAKGHP